MPRASCYIRPLLYITIIQYVNGETANFVYSAVVDGNLKYKRLHIFSGNDVHYELPLFTKMINIYIIQVSDELSRRLYLKLTPHT